MGLNLFADVDTINVHDYEVRKTGNLGKMEYVYSAYYEYFVTDAPLLNDPSVPEKSRGKHAWWYRVYDRKTGELLKRGDGSSKSYREGRKIAQLEIKKEMEKYRSGK